MSKTTIAKTGSASDGFWRRWLLAVLCFSGICYAAYFVTCRSIDKSAECTQVWYSAVEAARVKDFKTARARRARAVELCDDPDLIVRIDEEMRGIDSFSERMR